MHVQNLRIEHTISKTLWFRETEVGPDDTNGVGTSPEEAGLSAPVEGSWVHELWLDNTNDDTEDVVHVSGQDDSLDSETGRWHLSDQRVADGSDGNIVDEGEDKNESTRSP